MILTAGGKEVQFWVHLDNPDRPPMDNPSTSGRPPLPHESHAALLRAASSFKEKSPAIYRNLSVDGTRIYDSIKNPPEEKSALESASASSSGRIQYPNLPESTSSKQISLYDSYPSSSSLQQRSPSSSLQQRSFGDHSVKCSKPGFIPPAPPPLISRGLRQSSSALKKTHGGRDLLHKDTSDTWDRVFFQGVNTDVTIYAYDGYELDAHSMVLVSFQYVCLRRTLVFVFFI